MYDNGQLLCHDIHFLTHINSEVPIQIYYQGEHIDIGFLQVYSKNYIQVNGVRYSRKWFVFVSRPGY